MNKWWGLYSEKQGWWLECKTSNDYDHVSKIVFYPLKSMAEAHLQRAAGLYGSNVRDNWSVREFEADE
jgi:hypothetical protein